MFPIDFLVKAARAYPDAVAIEDASRTLSFSALLAEARALARAMQDTSGTTRPRVGILSPNSLDLMVAMMAIHAGGFWLVPLNPRNARAETDDQIRTAAPDLLVVDPSCLGRFTDGGVPVILTGASQGVRPGIRDLVARYAGAAPAWPGVQPGDANAIKFTGGSSGRPKGVLQSFRCFNTLVASMLLAFDFQPDERYLVAAPMTHGAGMFMMPVLARGGRCVVPEHAGPEMIVDALERFAITTTWLPPTLLYMLLEVPGADRRRYRLRHVIWGGAPAAPEKLRRAREVFGDVIEAVYGQTEASSIVTAMRAHEVTDDRYLGSVGRPTPLTTVEIMASDGRLLPPGERGEIVVRGDLVMNGYLDMPEVTAQTIVDGWLHTGDVGSFDERGYLFIKDRLRDVVISGGFNVYPSDIEAALCRHPGVHEAVVFGVPDAKWGERVEAAVQLKPGAVASAPEILAFVKEHVGSVKAPKQIHLMRDLPRSPVGKVLRREIRAAFSADPQRSLP